MAVWSQKGGSLKVNLPAPHEVMDALSRQRLETGSDVTIKLTPGETRLLDIKALPKRKDALPPKTESGASV